MQAKVLTRCLHCDIICLQRKREVRKMDVKKMTEEELREATIRNLLQMDEQGLLLMKSNAATLCMYQEMKKQEQQKGQGKKPA